MSVVGVSEDLPAGVYRQWRYWCSFPHYFFDAPSMPHLAEKFAAVNTPIIAANSLDDHWALPRSRDAFMQGYKNAPVRCVDLDPADGLGSIGHMEYFRPHASRLWDSLLLWFKQHLAF